MKLNLECQNNLRNDYINISSTPIPGDLIAEHNCTFGIGRYDNLSQIVEDESIEEIVFNKPINVIDPNNVMVCLQHWKNKLMVGGILKLYFIDIVKVSRDIVNGTRPLDQLHQMIFGNYEFKSIISYPIIKNALNNLDMEILTVEMNGHSVGLSCKKP